MARVNFVRCSGDDPSIKSTRCLLFVFTTAGEKKEIVNPANHVIKCELDYNIEKSTANLKSRLTKTNINLLLRVN